MSIAAAVLAASAFGVTGAAQAATKHHKRHHAHQAASPSNSTGTTSSGSSATGPTAADAVSPETELMGETAAKTKEAALVAVPGGTVARASIENPSDPSRAAYEVHVRKSDGSEVAVLMDTAFKVLSVTPDEGGGCH
jgi:uncharacterized membrane protein YkoI